MLSVPNSARNGNLVAAFGMTIAIFATIFHYLKQPTIVGFILAGIIVGPYGTGLVKSLPGAHLLSEITSNILESCLH